MRPTDAELQDQASEARVAALGPSKWPAMSYEDGVDAALTWALGETDEPPLGDE